MAENKTKATTVSVAAFLRKAASGQQLKDSQELVKLFKEITGKPAKMWGPSIVGFGSYHYVYESGREGDAPVIGFSPRKPETVLYITPCRGKDVSLKDLGKYKTRGGCLYIKKLDDIDRDVLKKLGKASVAELLEKYPPKR